MQFGGVEEEKATKQEGKETVKSLWYQQKTAEHISCNMSKQLDGSKIAVQDRFVYLVYHLVYLGRMGRVIAKQRNLTGKGLVLKSGNIFLLLLEICIRQSRKKACPFLAGE